MKFAYLLLLPGLLLAGTSALGYSSESCSDSEVDCRLLGPRSSSSASPDYNSAITANPSAVPTDNELGLETIYYKGSFDFLIVKGTGRIGAAISLTNNEETFFGPPGFEYSTDYLTRKIDKDKYPSQKYNFATAFEVYNNRHDGLKKVQVNIGVGARYNQLTHALMPGAGISGILGPITFGYAGTSDQTQLPADATGQTSVIHYQTQTASAGVYLTNFIFDYSLLTAYPEQSASFTINLLTATLLLKRFILTGSQRTENSLRPGFNYTTQTLTSDQVKKEVFGGLQFQINKHFTIGGFYNYYLQRELSAGLVFLL